METTKTIAQTAMSSKARNAVKAVNVVFIELFGTDIQNVLNFNITLRATDKEYNLCMQALINCEASQVMPAWS